MPKTTEPRDAAFMATALGLAGRGLGRSWPNPAVGCLVVKDGRVVGRGWTQPGGRPHAEPEALAAAGAAAAGATLYVTLEPCAHFGETPPCAGTVIAAKPARVVIATEDPDPRVAGRGTQMLKEAGIAVELGLLGDAARALNAGFFTRLAEGRPLVTLKLATSLDGCIAAASGASRWITGAAARARGHLLRAEHDGVLVGIGTALADDPDLTCRLPGMADRSPVRIVLDSGLRLPLASRLVASARSVPTWVVAAGDAPPERVAALADRGLRVIQTDSKKVAIGACLQELGRLGLTRLLVEGGGTVAAAFARAGLIDGIAWFRAPMLLGGDGTAALAALGIAEPNLAPRFRRTAVMALGEDILETFARAD